MTDSLLVAIGDVVVGTIERFKGGSLRFKYDDEYREGPGATPLSLSMPTQVQSHPDHVITPWLWGLLPDNDAVLRRWARQFHVSASSPFSLLSTQIGTDCPGAVSFLPAEQIERIATGPGEVDWLTDDQVAQRLRDLREDSTTWLGRSFTGQFSLAGSQAKTAMLFQGGRWGEPSGATQTTHIVKPAVAGLDDHDLNEHLCLDAAHRAGLITVRTTIVRFRDESAVVVERYDRRRSEDGTVRIHQEDFCQALGLPPTAKYQNEGGPGPAEIAALLHRAMPPRVADESVRRFADALIWNWLIAGTDAHAKNYSLLLANDQVRLAPLYDIASALPYGIHERKLRLAMKIGGDYRGFPQRNTWPSAANDLGLEYEEVARRVQELADIAPEAFAESAKTSEVADLGRPLPARLIDLVASRSRRCKQLVAAPSAAE